MQAPDLADSPVPCREARQAIIEQYLWAAGTALPSQLASAGSGDDVPDEVQSPAQRIRALANAASQVIAHMEAADKVMIWVSWGQGMGLLLCPGCHPHPGA